MISNITGINSKRLDMSVHKLNAFHYVTGLCDNETNADISFSRGLHQIPTKNELTGV